MGTMATRAMQANCTAYSAEYCPWNRMMAKGRVRSPASMGGPLGICNSAGFVPSARSGRGRHSVSGYDPLLC